MLEASFRHKLGLVDWFQPGEESRVEETLAHCRELGIEHLRFGYSWADAMSPEGRRFQDWLIDRLTGEVELLPCFTYTPPSLGLAPKSSSPPVNPKDYADFLDVILTRHGKAFEYVELWNEPNNRMEWDFTLDPDWSRLASMLGGAAYWVKKRGWKTVLGGVGPFDPNWIDVIGRWSVLEHIDVIGFHLFPGTWDYDFGTWQNAVDSVRQAAAPYGDHFRIWLTETGYSSRRNDEVEQVGVLADALEAEVDRAYWYHLQDMDPDKEHLEGLHEDERHYHCGILQRNGTPKLAYRLLRDSGAQGVIDFNRELTSSTSDRKRRLSGIHHRAHHVITGGAGFIGTNLADSLLRDGEEVLVFDNVSRPGVEANLNWLRERHGDRLQVEIGDVRDASLVQACVKGAASVYHLAAQVAVTSSLTDPQMDHEVNVGGTLNVLEAIRAGAPEARMLYTSTNKVYGPCLDLKLVEGSTRYLARSQDSISEDRPLSFQSPYGCSKGAADQYVLDYAHSFGLATTVFRMSCVYGFHQCGNEDQGWVAHFLQSALRDEPITIFGDGKQVRDALFVTDLVEAMRLAQRQAPSRPGRAYNIGGGRDRTLSLRELIQRIEILKGGTLDIRWADWRPADQRYYVSDTTSFRRATGWHPLTEVSTGIEKLWAWLEARESGSRRSHPATPPKPSLIHV